MDALSPLALVLSQAGLATAQKLRAALPGLRIAGLAGRVAQADTHFERFGAAIRAAYRDSTPILAFCAAGIAIRALAPLLADKGAEPPVLAVAEDGSAVVPLLGAGRGANALARRVAAALDGFAAVTTSGELRFKVNLLDPPPGYRLLNPEAAKGFISDLLAGGAVRIDGDAPWLEFSDLPVDPSAPNRIAIVTRPVAPGPRELVYLHSPPRGKLDVVGLGPGGAAQRSPEAAEALRLATDILGYEPYLRLAGPFRPDQRQHPTDNRAEMARARHALALAAQGRRVALVSSGDPGIFAMASAVLEALEEGEPDWAGVDLAILPGISAAMATAARAGAPLGHDFAVLSLSDNLKPWATIAARLEAAAAADLVLALYNPISRARPDRLGEALGLLRRHRGPATPVVVGREVGRPAETLLVTTLGALAPADVDSRSTLIVGSSTTRSVSRPDGGHWVYTPRWYPAKPEA